jgi:hypothetical protein
MSALSSGVRLIARHGRFLALAGALALIGASSAKAAIHERAVPIVAHYVQATGGQAARDAEQTLYVHGRIHAEGFNGTWEMWTAAPDRWARRYRLGPLRIREGYDGHVAWRTDLNEKSVHTLSTSETARAKEEGWYLNERWTRPDQDGASVMPGPSAYGTEATYDQIVVTAPGGVPHRLFINQKSGYIERVAYQIDGSPVEDHPGSYKMLGGRRRPSVYASPTLLPTDKPVEKLTVDSVAVNPPLDTLIFSPPNIRQRTIAWQNTSGTIRAPFTYGSKAVLVHVSINGAPPVEFILDTGASLSLLDESYAYSLGLRAEGKSGVNGIASSSEVRFARVKSIALAGPDSATAALRDFRVVLIDIAEGGKMMLWKKPMGILGADFLSRFVVEIDYDNQMVKLYDPAKFQYAGEGAPIPFELDGNCPIVDMIVDGTCEGKFLVDVGNSFHFTVHGSMVRGCRMIGTKKRAEVEVSGGGIGGGFVSTLCRLDSVQIGPFSWSEPVAALALHTTGGIGSKEISGNIGNSVLERFKCTFDYAHQVLYLEPGRRFPERDRVSRFGALFIRYGFKVYAGDVMTHSAAYEAGLRWFDEIVAVDGKPLDDWTREEVDKLLEEGELGSEHKVTYRRFTEDRPKTVTVVLKDVL